MNAALAALGLDPLKQATLLRTRGRLTMRQFTREPGRIVGLVMAALFFAPLAIGASIGTAIGYLRLPEPWPAQLLGIVLVALWLIWLVAPFFAFNLNEGLDLTRLLVYPLARRDLFASQLLGTLFDVPTYFMLPLFAAVLVGWGLSPALPVVLAGLFLSYAHMIVGSQLILTAAGGILRSRRFRDVAIIVFSLLGSTCYFLQRGLIELFSRYVDFDQLAALRPLRTLQWLPPGAVARAVERATAGDWGSALLWLLYATALLAVVAWAWWRLLVRVTTGEGFLLSLGAPAAPRVVAARRAGSAAAGDAAPERLYRIPAGVRQLALKEFLSAWRIPQRRVALLQGVLLPFVFIGVFLLGGDVPRRFGQLGSLGLPFFGLFIAWATCQNMLGWEGPGLATLLLSPIPRERIFLGKGLALNAIAGGSVLLVGIVALLMTRHWTAVAGGLAAVGVSLATSAVAMVASVLFPYPVNLQGTTRRSTFSTGGSCLTGLANAFLVPAVAFVVSLPAALPLVVGYWWRVPAVGIVGGLASVVYGLALLAVAVRLAGRLLLPREAEVLAATRPPETGG